ncbi:hypothetical protein Droror1_Dr00016077 [Drosera rotundifolia]
MSQKLSSNARELHRVKKNMNEIDESRRTSETIKAEAELELLEAKKTAKKLSLQIEESKSKARQQEQDIRTTNKATEVGDWQVLAPRKMENHQNDKVIREVESIKLELSQLKLDKARVLQEKSEAEKKLKALMSRTEAHMQSSEELREQIEELNEEIVLVELARIEAVKELAVVEAQRKEESQTFSLLMEEKSKGIGMLMEGTGRVKALKEMLAVTNSEIEVLQSELNFIREIEKMANTITAINTNETDESLNELNTVKEEIEALKKELASKKEQGFQSMVSMDLIRKELDRTLGEIARLKKRELKEEKAIEKLNSRLIKARDKLEAAYASEATVKNILSSMSATRGQLEAGTQAANKERELLVEETARIKSEVEETDFLTGLVEETVKAAIEELEEVRSSQFMALAKLKALADNTMRTRALAGKHNRIITISKFEYEYLRGCAAGAREVADKKVEAAEACIEALKMSEKEIVMETEMARRELRELNVKEVQELHRVNKSLTVKELVDAEFQSKRDREIEDTEEHIMEPSPTIKPTKDASGSSRMSKHRKSTTQGRHAARSSSLMIRRRRRVMLNLARCFAGKQIIGGLDIQEVS